MDNSFKTLINSASEFQEFVISLPDKPNLDEVASALSVYLALMESKKKANVICFSAMTAEFSRLIAVDKIVSSSENKNLTIKFINYDASKVDKVSYDIENGQFKLIVNPKTGYKSPTKDQIEIDYSGLSAEFLILIGGKKETDFAILKNSEFTQSKIIHIGNKLLEIEDKSLPILSFAKQSSSVSEVVVDLLNENGFIIDADIATNLLAGIEIGSDNFQGEGVTSKTFEIFAGLLKLGGVRMKKILPGSFPQGSIPTKPFSQPQVVAEKVMTPEEAEEEIQQDIPPSWSEPKIFTGTSVS